MDYGSNIYHYGFLPSYLNPSINCKIYFSKLNIKLRNCVCIKEIDLRNTSTVLAKTLQDIIAMGKAMDFEWKKTTKVITD